MTKVIRSRTIEVDYNAPDWHEQQFLESLHFRLSEYEQKENPVSVLKRLLMATDSYLENMAIEDRSPLREEIHDIFSTLNVFLLNDALGKKIKRHQNSLAIGECIAALKYFGMPRLHAIRAVSEWLGIGVSTVRTYNEIYRKQYPNRFLSKGSSVSIYRPLMLKYIKENPVFPFDHPKAKRAFKSYKASLFEKRSLEINIEQIMRKVSV